MNETASKVRESAGTFQVMGPDMDPAISVIVPHLNQPVALKRLLDSLYSQEADGIPFEIIIADNGSEEELSDDINSCPGVTVVRESTPGPGPARNRGVSVSRGNILAFIDSDCIADRFWIKTIFQYFDGENAADVIGGDVRIATNNTPMSALEAYESVFGYRFYLYIQRDGYAGTGNLAVRKEVFETVGAFAGIQVAEDRDWGLRASQAGFSLAYVPEMVIHTPARKSFSELARKWDRHIAHDFRRMHGIDGRLKWILRSALLALSPFVEIPRVLTSDRIQGARARVLAWSVLVRIRLFRTRRMLAVFFGGDVDDMAYAWRRKP